MVDLITHAMGALLNGFRTGETPIKSYTTKVKESYNDYNDAAIIVFSRIGGEGYDLPRTMQVVLLILQQFLGLQMPMIIIYN